MDNGTLNRSGDAAAGLVFWLALALALVAYWPGLSGIFLLDDIPNLGTMEHHVAMGPLERFLTVITSGPAGVLGRPLAFASFMINDHSWPTDPRPFLYTNLMIHLLNGCLVFWLVRLLVARLPDVSRFQVHFVSLVAAALWLLHPLNTSTVLYVVQRMTELASTFMLAGLLMYIKGRLRLPDRPKSGYLLMSAGMAVGIGVGSLSKEIALMLPVYVLVMEILLRRGQAGPPPSRAWQAVFLYLPLLFVLFWHAWAWRRIAGSYSLREFTIGERLLTEARIFFDYLSDILLPNRVGTGLFQDDLAVSTSLLEPTSTLFAVIGVILLAAAAVALIRKLPVLSFAILWFIAGHLLESTLLPLELAFEHRNYLPMIGPLVAVAWYLSLITRLRLRYFSVFAGLALVSLSAFATWNNATLWGQPLLLADTWAREHPDSIRAQTFAAGRWENRGAYGRAYELLKELVERRPDATSAHLSLMMMECKLNMAIPRERIQDVAGHLQTAPKDTAAPVTIRNLLIVRRERKCDSYSLDDLQTFTDALLANDNFRSGKLRRNLHITEAEVYWAKRNYGRTVEALNAALEYDRHDLRISEILAYVHASAGNYDYALEVIEDVEIQPVLGYKPRAKVERLEDIKRQLKADKQRYTDRNSSTSTGSNASAQ